MRHPSIWTLSAVATLVSLAFGCAALADATADNKEKSMTTEQTLSNKQRAIPPIAAATAAVEGTAPTLGMEEISF
jgi:hypothetical protein